MTNSFSLFTQQKKSLQLSLKLWLPLLQVQVQDLEEIFKEHSFENPFLEYTSSFELNYSSISSMGNKSGFIENVSFSQESLYEKITKQLEAPIFPTPISQNVAKTILLDINSEGYFEGSIEKIALKCKTTEGFVEKIRQRFSYLEPSGVAAIDLKESFSFQLSQLDIDDELDILIQGMIKNLKQIDKYYKHHRFEQAIGIVKRFKRPPAIDYLQESSYIIPDVFVEVKEDIIVKLNHSYYPDVVVKDVFKTKNDDLKTKLKEARDLVNLLELRKSTLYKLVLIIVQRQIDFFLGSELKPMTMAQVAEDIGFEESTISRAVSNKYLKCERGIFSLKSFFTNGLTKSLSSAEIKNYIQTLIENEDSLNPLRDQDLVDIVIQRYNIKMVRRTITKYRKLLNIPSSKQRKKMYRLS